MERLEGIVSVELNGLSPKVTIQVNDPLAIYMAANSIITSIARYTEISFDDVIENIRIFNDSVKIYQCESKEQADVVRELINKGVFDA